MRGGAPESEPRGSPSEKEPFRQTLRKSPFGSAICENGTWPPVTAALGLSGIVIAGTPSMYSKVWMWPRSQQRRSCLSYASAYLKLDVPTAPATGASVTARDAGSTLTHTTFFLPYTSCARYTSWPETMLSLRPDTLRVGSTPPC